MTADKLEYGLYWVRRPLVTARQNEDGTWTILPAENRRYLRLTDEEFRATFIVPERGVKEDQALAIQALGNLMSDISERCYCAGWMIGTEDAIGELVDEALVTGQDARSGFWYISLYEARLLKMLHDYVGGWVTLGEDAGYTLVE